MTVDWPISVADDSLLFAIAPNSHSLGAMFDDVTPSKAVPGVPPDVAWRRITLRMGLSAGAEWSVSAYLQAAWLSSQYPNSLKVSKNPLPAVTTKDIVENKLFNKLAVLLPLLGQYPAKVEGKSLAQLLRTTPNTLFQGGLPAKGNIEALRGFGMWLAALWRAGKPLPIPVSRAVLRVAFGGKLIADDFGDVSQEFTEAAPTEQQILDLVKTRETELAALRAGVVAAGVQVWDSPIWPRVFQLRPARMLRKTVLPRPLACLLWVPAIRREIWERRARWQVTEEREKELIQQLLAELAN
jgi:hypothetical protein